jgi:hypothetical protein
MAGSATLSISGRARRPRPRIVAVAAAVSLVTMPITAIWFLVLAPVVAFVGAAAAVAQPEPEAKDRMVWTAASLALGLLAGPALYLVLALGTG